MKSLEGIRAIHIPSVWCVVTLKGRGIVACAYLGRFETPPTIIDEELTNSYPICREFIAKVGNSIVGKLDIVKSLAKI